MRHLPNNSRPRACAGFTLIEITVAIGMIAVLASLALPIFRGWKDKVRTNTAQDEILAISMVVDAFLADSGRLPVSLGEVGRSGKKDPWGNDYQYRDLSTAGGNGLARKDHSLVPLNTDFDLYSSGPDGQSSPALTAASSRDDILRANNGRFVGPANRY